MPNLSSTIIEALNNLYSTVGSEERIGLGDMIRDGNNSSWRHVITAVDNVSTDLPTPINADIFVDGIQLIEGNKVLFTALSNPVHNNRVYEVSNLHENESPCKWTIVEDGQNEDGSSAPGDIAYVLSGTLGSALYVFDDDAWNKIPSGGGGGITGPGSSTQYELVLFDGTDGQTVVGQGGLGDKGTILTAFNDGYPTWFNALIDSDGNSVLIMNLRSLYDTSVNVAIDWQNRSLVDSSGQTVLAWDANGNGVNFNNHRLSNLVDPVDAQDAATKQYVQDAIGGGGTPGIHLDGSNSPTSDIDWDSHKITSLAYPTDPNDAASKQYVDDNSGGGGIAPFIITTEGSDNTITLPDVDIGGQADGLKIRGIFNESGNGGDLILVAGKTNFGGSNGTVKIGEDANSLVTLSGAITVSNTLVVPTPTQSTHAATKQYVDDAVGGGGTPSLHLDGSNSPTSNISWDSNKITDLLDPTQAQDAATKQYVDDVAAGANIPAAITAYLGTAQTERTILNKFLFKGPNSPSANVGDLKIGIPVAANSDYPNITMLGVKSIIGLITGVGQINGTGGDPTNDFIQSPDEPTLKYRGFNTSLYCRTKAGNGINVNDEFMFNMKLDNQAVWDEAIFTLATDKFTSGSFSNKIAAGIQMTMGHHPLNGGGGLGAVRIGTLYDSALGFATYWGSENNHLSCRGHVLVNYADFGSVPLYSFGATDSILSDGSTHLQQIRPFKYAYFGDAVTIGHDGTGAPFYFTPNYHLDIRQRTAATPVYSQWSINTTTTYATTRGLLIGLDSSANAVIKLQENTDLLISTNSTSRGKVTAAGSWVLGSTSILTNAATDGFTYIPTVSGAPNGAPNPQGATVAMQFDTATNKLWIYNGAWKSVTLS